MLRVSAFKKVFLVVSCLISLPSLSSPRAAYQEVSNNLISEIGSSSAEWKKRILVLTREPLWSERDAYDASHVLMTPMHFAFAAGDENGIKQFEYLMGRFAGRELPSGQLTQAQWIYFVSRYLALRSEFNYPLSAVDSYLVQRVSNWLHSKWLYEPAYQWGQLPLTGAKSRIDLIKAEFKWRFSYYPAIKDYELFLFSVASDMQFVFRKQAGKISIAPEVEGSIKEMRSAGVSVVRERGVFTDDGGWLFQPGIWSDYPDFRFAGHSELKPDLEERRVRNISEDSSHSHRWPLFFRSMIAATDSEGIERDLLIKAYHGFSKQFTQKVVIIKGRSVLLSNYMDGGNGVYRYKYATVGRNDKLGYGASALSGVLGVSWYPFANNVSGVYQVYKESYPLNEKTVSLYVGPNTIREVNPLFKWPGFFTDGFAELIARQGAYISMYYQQIKK